MTNSIQVSEISYCSFLWGALGSAAVGTGECMGLPFVGNPRKDDTFVEAR